MKLKDLIEQYGEHEVSGELIAQLQGLKPKTVWDLQKGDEYYLLCGDGYIDYYNWDGGETDSDCVYGGNVFLTMKEAKADLERRKVETLLLKYGGRRWFKKDGNNYHIWLMPDESIRVSRISVSPLQGVIYFDSREQAEKAIEEIGEDRFIMALFEER